MKFNWGELVDQTVELCDRIVEIVEQRALARKIDGFIAEYKAARTEELPGEDSGVYVKASRSPRYAIGGPGNLEATTVEEIEIDLSAAG